MEHDLIELARICSEHAKAAKAPKVAAALLRLAKNYQRRAARLRGDSERGRSAQHRRGQSALVPQVA